MYSVLYSTDLKTLRNMISNISLIKLIKKTCELDPVPATIFQGCKKSLLPLFAKIVNKSLQSGCMPEKLKEAVLKPKLKNDSLNSDEYISF